jgi:hypothetical protein
LDVFRGRGRYALLLSKIGFWAKRPLLGLWSEELGGDNGGSRTFGARRRPEAVRANMSDLIKPNSKTGSQSGATDTERRIGDRHTFTASADVTEMSSGARFSTRMTDLSFGGCFVDTMVPFPVGAKVHIKVHRGNNEFETRGVVVYSQYGLGMGVAFESLDPEDRKALDHWIAELSGGQSGREDVERSLASAGSKAKSDGAGLARLIQVLVDKAVLTDVEGASILQDPPTPPVDDPLF